MQKSRLSDEIHLPPKSITPTPDSKLSAPLKIEGPKNRRRPSIKYSANVLQVSTMQFSKPLPPVPQAEIQVIVDIF
jgi:hypothetical protein